jgi:hypothetical protein
VITITDLSKYDIRAMDDQYGRRDTPMSFSVMVRVREKCSKFSFGFMSLHKVIVYLVWQRCHAYTYIRGPIVTVGW